MWSDSCTMTWKCYGQLYFYLQCCKRCDLWLLPFIKDKLADTAFVLCIHVCSETVNSSMKKRVGGICLLFITAYGHMSLWNTINGVICFCCRKTDTHLNETDSACVVKLHPTQQLEVNGICWFDGEDSSYTSPKCFLMLIAKVQYYCVHSSVLLILVLSYIPHPSHAPCWWQITMKLACHSPFLFS